MRGALLPLLLALSAAPARAADPPEEVRLLASEVAALGTEATPWFAVDLSRLTCEERARDATVELLEAETALLRRPARRTARQALLAAWGRAGEGDREAHRLQGLPARYLIGPRALLLVRGVGAPEGLPSRGLLVAHELVRAWQDQQLDLAPRLEAAAASSEETWLLQALLEGQAGAVALAVSRARIRSSLREVDPDALEVPAERRLLGALQALCLGRGRAFAVRAFQRGGWAALRDLPTAPPASSEQLLHPEKLGRDAPRGLELPPWPAAAGPQAELVDQDVLGELGLLALLTELGLPDDQAARAATGWDGDRLVTWRSPNGRLALAWRTVWDRAEDAAQFAAALEKRWAGRWDVNDRVVDAVWGEGRLEVEAALAEALRGHVYAPGPADEDALSTAAIESQAARRDVLGTQRWKLREEQVSLPIPPGWNLHNIQGRTYLMARPELGFGDNLNVIETENPAGDDGEALARQTRSDLEGAGGRVVALERRQGPRGEPAVLAEYTLRYQGRPLHFLVLVLARGARAVVITATTPEERWAERKDLFRAMLGDVRGLDER